MFFLNIFFHIEKNNAYEKLLSINLNKGKETSLEELILKELLEEGGYDCELNELIALDWCWEGKASDTKVYLYSIDLTDKDRQQASGDGSDGEKGTYCKWESYDKIKKHKCMRLNSVLFKLREVKPNLWQKED